MTDFLRTFLQDAAQLLAQRVNQVVGLAIGSVVLFMLLRIVKWQSRRIETQWARFYPPVEDTWLAEPLEGSILAIILNGPSWWWDRILYPGGNAALRPGNHALHVLSPSNTSVSEMRGGHCSIPWGAIHLDLELGVAHFSRNGQNIGKLKLSPIGAYQLNKWLETHP